MNKINFLLVAAALFVFGCSSKEEKKSESENKDAAKEEVNEEAPVEETPEEEIAPEEEMPEEAPVEKSADAPASSTEVKTIDKNIGTNIKKKVSVESSDITVGEEGVK